MNAIENNPTFKRSEIHTCAATSMTLEAITLRMMYYSTPQSSTRNTIHRDKEWNRGCQGRRKSELFNRHRISVWDNRKDLKSGL